MVCAPTFTTAALFVAVVIFDLIYKNYNYAKGHTLMGIPAILLMQSLCENGSPYIGWGLLVVPFILLIISFLIATNSSNPSGNNMNSVSTNTQIQQPLYGSTGVTTTPEPNNIQETQSIPETQTNTCNLCDIPSPITPCELCKKRAANRLTRPTT